MWISLSPHLGWGTSCAGSSQSSPSEDPPHPSAVLSELFTSVESGCPASIGLLTRIDPIEGVDPDGVAVTGLEPEGVGRVRRHRKTGRRRGLGPARSWPEPGAADADADDRSRSDQERMLRHRRSRPERAVVTAWRSTSRERDPGTQDRCRSGRAMLQPPGGPAHQRPT